MLYNYIALILFLLFGVFVPAAFLLTAKILGRVNHPNEVKNAPYESGEKTIGSSRDIDVEYFPYLMLFLPFEVVAMLTLLWASAASTIGRHTGIYVMLLLVIAAAFSMFGYRIIRDKNGAE